VNVDTGVKVSVGKRKDVAELVSDGVTDWFCVGVELWSTFEVALGT